MFSYFNYRRHKLPTTIGVLLISLVLSLPLILLSRFGFPMEQQAADLLVRIDFNEALLHGMLAFLLFSGAFPWIWKTCMHRSGASPCWPPPECRPQALLPVAWPLGHPARLGPVATAWPRTADHSAYHLRSGNLFHPDPGPDPEKGGEAICAREGIKG